MEAELLSIVRDYVAKSQYKEALEELDLALKLTPSDSAALHFKAEIYFRMGGNKSAEECLLLALKYAPEDIGILIKLWDHYFQQKRYNDIFEATAEITERDPRNVYALRACGVALSEMDRPEEAVEILERAESEAPGYIPTSRMLANLHLKLNHLKEAEKYYNVVHESDPDDLWVLTKLCQILSAWLWNGNHDCAERASLLANRLVDVAKGDMDGFNYVQIIALASVDLDLQAKLGDKKDLLDYWANNLMNRMLFLQKSRVETMQDRLNLLEAHRLWGAKVEASIDVTEIKHRVRQRLNSKIRFGFISADFRSNHVGHYIWPLIENLDRDKFEIHCYAQLPAKDDQLQQQFKSIVDDFKECPMNGDARSIAQAIADDCLDVLLETGAWFVNPELIAYRPAPLQISWLDYAHSMGLPTAVDYIVVDPYVKPESNNLLIEKPLILPETWISMHPYGFPDVPITASTPEDRNGYITFGVMNAVYRLTEENFRVWAEIMNMVPNSRLVYIRPEAETGLVRDNFCKYMEKYGISRERISFLAKRDKFIECYNEIDIALDTFPHMGATTSCSVLWMGLPLVTLAGPCFFERVSYSALSNCGLSDLCAFSLQEYHNIAIALVADKERRKYIRKNLRSWILNGPLGQTKRFADNMGNAIAGILGRG